MKDRSLVILIALSALTVLSCQQPEKTDGDAGQSASEADPAGSNDLETASSQDPGEQGESGSEQPEAPANSTAAEIVPLSLDGEYGSTERWGSGWLDLGEPLDLARGDQLRIRVGGTAEKILVRLLPKGKAPDSSAGIVGGTVGVPENRVVDVIVPGDRKSVIQISVHGGPNPFNRSLGPGNGPATVEAVELIRATN